MKRMLIIAGAVLSMMIVVTGCDADSRGAKVSPQTTLENDGYYENSDNGSNSNDENWYNENIDDANESFELLTVFFDYDSYKLTSDAIEIMNQNAETMMKNSNIVIKIAGHCDERGTEEYNLALGEKRARSILDYLAKYGIDNARLSIISYGESNPVDYSGNENAWSKNRRADFAVISK